VKSCKNVYESLKKYTAKEVLEGENQYDAGELGKRDAEKGVIFTKLPPVLTIHLKRFDFDLEKMVQDYIYRYLPYFTSQPPNFPCLMTDVGLC
jgi:ubiquitin C-terminal hydrolase